MSICRFCICHCLIYLSHNPLGKIWSETELRQIGNLCLERGVTILSDEVYERVHYTPSFSRIATLSDDFWKITLTVSSIGKMFNATGWRLGFVIGPSNLIKTLQWAHIIVSYVTAGPVQEAAARGFKLAHDYGFWQQNKDFMRRKMDAFCDGLRDIGLPVSILSGIHVNGILLMFMTLVRRAERRLFRLRQHQEN